ncbi:MAG: hypothetical protein E6H58_07870 [Betaproteobacteria bacterium]|nr:MAG: hypothetical protein E6H58_07870 [Betaproteobacteria bacterium]
MTRRFMPLLCRALIGVMLFAQMAVAAHACPQMAASMSHQPEQMVDAADAASDPSDQPVSNACLEHCRHGQQSADHTSAPVLPAALLVGLYTLPAVIDAFDAARARAAPDGGATAAPPPHAILHCCLRI